MPVGGFVCFNSSTYVNTEHIQFTSDIKHAKLAIYLPKPASYTEMTNISYKVAEAWKQE